MSNLIQLLQGKQAQLTEDLRLFHDSHIETGLPLSMVEKVECLYNRFNDIQSQLESMQHENLDLISNQDLLQSERDFRRLYFALTTKAPLQPASKVECASDSSHNTAIQLPKIEITKFNGSLSQYQNFISSFDASIHSNTSLSGIQKFQYLRLFLEGDALELIETIPLLEANYQLAYSQVVARYANKRRLANYYFNQINDFIPATQPSYRVHQTFLTKLGNARAGLLRIPDIDIDDFLLFSLCYQKLDPLTRGEFEKSIVLDEFPTVDKLLSFVTDNLRMYEFLESGPTSTSNSPAVTGVGTRAVKPPHGSNQTRGGLSKVLTSTNISSAYNPDTTRASSCVICKSLLHRIYQCPEFLVKTLPDKFQLCRTKNLCFSCLGSHARKDCQSKNLCKICKSDQHHTLLHNHELQNVSALNALAFDCGTSPSHEPTSAPPAVNLSAHTSTAVILLGTAQIQLLDHTGHIITCRAILDTGAQRSLITNRLVQKLRLKIKPAACQLSGIDQIMADTKGSTELTIVPPHAASFCCTPIIVAKITSEVPSTSLSESLLERFSHLTLADPQLTQSAAIDLLLGLDVYDNIMLPVPNLIGQPSAISTVFGWVLLGNIPITDDTSASSRTNTATALLANVELNRTLQQFWDTEEVQVPKIPNPDEERAEAIFKISTTRTSTGRYMTALPFRDNIIPLGSNHKGTTKQFLRFERHLSNHPVLLSKYHEFMSEYLNLGHMSLAHTHSSYVIPHHCVLKPSSSTTKLRAVFNASSPDNNGLSLNARLLAGPKLQRDICSILTNFRLYQIAICTDIRMMYRQILIRPEDRWCQHIFYRSNSDNDVSEYQLNTVTYGLTSSAFLAQRVLLQLTVDEGSSFPIASNAIRQHTYVDDIITGASSVAQAEELVTQLTCLLNKGGFELRKWSSNCKKVLHNLPNEFLENPLVFSEDSTIKILGIQWNPSTDMFSYHVTPFDGKPTKRCILSYTARMYDPLGFLAPIIFKAKHFMKSLWLLDLDWDDLPPDHIIQSWDEFTQQFSRVPEISVPRVIVSDHAEYRLLGFCDASELGYAAVIYMHVTNKQEVSTFLLKSKSRVAPAKTMTIPRLELCAALLLARLYNSLIDGLQSITITSVHLFSDAAIVLHWLRTPPFRLKTFIANRVSEISDLTCPSMWSHISSHLNPADIASRGLFPSQLIGSKLWWHGPSIFHAVVDCWPPFALPDIPSNTSEIMELRTLPALLVSDANPNKTSLIDRFSSYPRLLHVVCYMLRFIHHAQRIDLGIQTTTLSVEELLGAERLCIKITQDLHFPKLKHQIRTGSVKPNSIRALSPFVDTYDLIRVGGRLRNSRLPAESKFPYLLPKKCQLSTIICDSYHINALHAGPRTTQSLILQKFWIISLRSLLRWRIYNCVRCLRYQAKPVQPIMSELPSYRVQQQRPFQSVGVDFAGPFMIKTNRLRTAKLVKGYLCVFVCMATKATHLECVSDLTTEAFLASLDRFIARRGLPHNISSDQGTNLVGAARHLREIYRNLHRSHSDIQNHLNDRGIKWNFNPPAAPNFGGLWEAAVKSAKVLIFRTLQMTKLTFEEYSTLFARIEAILNSRPLFEFSSDPQENMTMLTPGHFLIGSSLLQPPERTYEPNITLTNRWCRIRQMAQGFWLHWSNNYLHTQIQRHKWNRADVHINIGDLVIVRDLSSAPLNWPFGVVIKLHLGRDGCTRVVDVRTSFGTFTRPLNKLVLVPQPAKT